MTRAHEANDDLITSTYPQPNPRTYSPSNMFFKLIESDDLKPFRSQFKYIFWAESDVEPIRPMWADALFIEATLPTSYNGAAPDWWMKGSMVSNACVWLASVGSGD